MIHISQSFQTVSHLVEQTRRNVCADLFFAEYDVRCEFEQCPWWNLFQSSVKLFELFVSIGRNEPSAWYERSGWEVVVVIAVVIVERDVSVLDETRVEHAFDVESSDDVSAVE